MIEIILSLLVAGVFGIFLYISALVWWFVIRREK